MQSLEAVQKTAVSINLGVFYSQRPSAAIANRCSRRLQPVTNNSSLYEPNENLIDRNNLQVSLNEVNDHGFGTDEYESFESDLEITPPTSSPSSSHVINIFSSTPVGAPSYLRVHQSQSQLPAVSLQPHNIISMLQEQQVLLH